VQNTLADDPLHNLINHLDVSPTSVVFSDSDNPEITPLFSDSDNVSPPPSSPSEIGQSNQVEDYSQVFADGALMQSGSVSVTTTTTTTTTTIGQTSSVKRKLIAGDVADTRFDVRRAAKRPRMYRDDWCFSVQLPNDENAQDEDDCVDDCRQNCCQRRIALNNHSEFQATKDTNNIVVYGYRHHPEGYTKLEYTPITSAGDGIMTQLPNSASTSCRAETTACVFNPRGDVPFPLSELQTAYSTHDYQLIASSDELCERATVTSASLYRGERDSNVVPPKQHVPTGRATILTGSDSDQPTVAKITDDKNLPAARRTDFHPCDPRFRLSAAPLHSPKVLPANSPIAAQRSSFGLPTVWSHLSPPIQATSRPTPQASNKLSGLFPLSTGCDVQIVPQQRPTSLPVLPLDKIPPANFDVTFGSLTNVQRTCHQVSVGFSGEPADCPSLDDRREPYLSLNRSDMRSSVRDRTLSSTSVTASSPTAAVNESSTKQDRSTTFAVTLPTSDAAITRDAPPRSLPTGELTPDRSHCCHSSDHENQYSAAATPSVEIKREEQSADSSSHVGVGEVALKNGTIGSSRKTLEALSVKIRKNIEEKKNKQLMRSSSEPSGSLQPLMSPSSPSLSARAVDSTIAETGFVTSSTRLQTAHVTAGRTNSSFATVGNSPISMPSSHADHFREVHACGVQCSGYCCCSCSDATETKIASSCFARSSEFNRSSPKQNKEVRILSPSIGILP
jgi:hypothetical protein